MIYFLFIPEYEINDKFNIYTVYNPLSTKMRHMVYFQ